LLGCSRSTMGHPGSVEGKNVGSESGTARVSPSRKTKGTGMSRSLPLASRHPGRSGPTSGQNGTLRRGSVTITRGVDSAALVPPVVFFFRLPAEGGRGPEWFADISVPRHQEFRKDWASAEKTVWAKGRRETSFIVWWGGPATGTKTPKPVALGDWADRGKWGEFRANLGVADQQRHRPGNGLRGTGGGSSAVTGGRAGGVRPG